MRINSIRLNSIKLVKENFNRDSSVISEQQRLENPREKLKSIIDAKRI